MKINSILLFLLLTMSFVRTSFGQEQPQLIIPIDQNDLYENNKEFIIAYTLDKPSLSYLKRIPVSNFTLMEIDLSVDLRRQAFHNKTPFLYESKNPHVQENFSVRLPSQILNKTRISGRNRLDFTVNRGSVRNSVYKDASFYTGAYNPFTGLPY